MVRALGRRFEGGRGGKGERGGDEKGQGKVV